MPKHLILVAGNIGSGKTSLTERIGERLGWRTAYESVADNPYLPDFYKDMKTWSFHLQVFFLGHRAKQHQEMAADPRSAIIDRSIYEDAYIFHKRGRDIESSITADYLSLLESYYDDWMESFDICPVLTIRTNDLDFVHKAKHLDIVIQRIKDKLSGKEEVVF